jgi:protoheme IX farnesyltransferase
MEVSESKNKGVMGKVLAALDLFKLRLTFLVVVSCILSYAMGVDSWEFSKLGWLILAGFLLTGGSNGANQVLERQWDALMHRTKNRPLPTQRISPIAAWFVSVSAAASGIFILFYFLNTASGILGFAAFLSYAFVYTPLKRVTPWAVFIGAFPGAIAPMIGYVAATNEFGLEAGILFAVQFMWQFPHFWAIAWVSHEDYNRGGYKLLPFNGMPDIKTAFQIMVYSFFLIPVSLLPWTLPLENPMVGNIAAVIVTIAGIWISFLAYKLFKEPTLLNARKVMFASFFYLPIVQIAYVIDKI